MKQQEPRWRCEIAGIEDVGLIAKFFRAKSPDAALAKCRKWLGRERRWAQVTVTADPDTQRKEKRGMQKCPECGYDAYVGSIIVECTNQDCRHYKPGAIVQGKKPDESKPETIEAHPAAPCGCPHEEMDGFMGH